jgi:copper chaperone CopZ
MNKIKIFQDINAFEVEKEINEWIEKINPDIISVSSSTANSTFNYLTVTILYEDNYANEENIQL